MGSPTRFHSKSTGFGGKAFGKAEHRALATGLAYYHRPSHPDRWREPPNFLNPFWRATLVPASVESSANGDEFHTRLDEVFAQDSAGSREMLEILRQLDFKAWP
jgi:hypothetical protein